MADERKPSSLRNLLENIYEVHRKDIKTYASGHLNPSKLLKPPDGHHAKWETSDKPPVRLKPPSKLVDLPVRKGELTRRERRQKNMADCLMEFSLGPMKSLVSQSEFSGESTKKSTKEESKTTRDNLALDKIHVEELHLPEIMIPLSKKKGSNRKHHPEDVRHAFVETYLSYPTKAEQFSSFRNFGDDVMNIGDAHDKEVLTGERTVRKLEHKLSRQLAALEAASQKGPNFHRLQIYNNCLDEIISESKTFGPLLKRIKEEYDSYMSHLLDSQKPSQHRVLYHHIDSLSESPSTSGKLKAEQKRVELLECEAKMLLDENARLKQMLTEEELKSADETQFITPAEPQSIKLSAVHVEEVPKDLEEQVEELHAQILAQLDSIDEIKRYQKEYCVPITVCQHLEQCIKETEVDIQKLLKQNEFLEQTIQELEHELELLLERTETKEKDSRKLWKQINMGAVLGQNK